jgi:ketosteroid isomerase-like protein
MDEQRLRRCVRKGVDGMSVQTYGNAVSAHVATPKYLVRAVLAALSQGNISEAVDKFDNHFTFNDRALGLELAEKGRLTAFFKKSRELFPYAAIQVVSAYESGDSAFAEWKLTATWPTYYISVPVHLPISLSGASIARVGNGRIVTWSDYYDEKTSKRLTLASSFLE